MKRVLTACLPVILAACGGGSETSEQPQQGVQNGSQADVSQLSDVSQPVTIVAGSQYDLMPRIEAALATALPGQEASDEADMAVPKRNTSFALDDVAYSVDTIYGASARDWAAQQWDKTARYGLMGLLNETVAKRLCMLSYWTGSDGNFYEPTAVQRTIGVDVDDLTGKAGEALQGFCPSLTTDDLSLLSAAAPLQIWYEVTDLSLKPASLYTRSLNYQITGSAHNNQDGFWVSGQFIHTISTQRLAFVLTEQSDLDSGFLNSLYVAFNEDADRDGVALEAQQITGNADTGRQAIYRLRVDRQSNEAAVLLHAHQTDGYPASDLAVLMTSTALADGEVAISFSADGVNPIQNAFACADRLSLRVNAAAGTLGVCDGTTAVMSSPWLISGKPLMRFDPDAIEAIDETSIVSFESVDEMLLSAPVTAE